MNTPQSTPTPQPAPKSLTARFVWSLVLALAMWGTYLAIGSLIYRPENTDDLAWLRGIRRGLLVVGCFAGFLAFWLALLRLRARRG